MGPLLPPAIKIIHDIHNGMKTNKEKFKALVSKEKTDTVSKNKERIKNRATLRESQQIALNAITK